MHKLAQVDDATGLGTQYPMLSAQDHIVLDRTLNEIYRLRDLDGFVVAAMEELPKLVYCDVLSFNEVNYSGRRMATVLNSPRVQKLYHERQLVFEPILHQNPLIEHSAKTLDGPVKIADFMTLDEWHSTEIYRAFYVDVPVEHQMAVALPVEKNLIVAFAFNRKGPDFTERDREVLAVLHPHLTQAYKNARRYTEAANRLARAGEALHEIGAGWIDLDADMTLLSATELARSSLAWFFGDPNGASTRLPKPLEGWLLDNRTAALAGERVAPFVLEQEVGRLIVRLVASAQTGDMSLLTERFLTETSPKPLEELGLTPRQAEVLYWICQGKSNAEIAVILRIKVRTVVFHVSQILKILGVTNRTEAAHRASAHLSSRR